MIPAGQRVLLAGASGSGKSTVLRALAGLLDDSTGELTGSWSPAEQAGQRPGERGMLLQQPLHALVGENVGRDAAFGPENLGLDRPGIQERVSSALRAARVDLPADRRCLDASGGQQQRIALAGSLALQPGALLLDEPTSMLDAEAAEAVRTAVLDAAAGRTLVIAEHRIAPWLDHVDRLVVLGPRAQILADGPPAGLLAEARDVLAGAGLWLPDDRGHAGRLRTDAEDAAPRSRAARPAADAPPVARLEGVAIRRRGRMPRGRGSRRRSAPVLARDITADLAPGSLTALTGPSGAGKTTLLRVLLGLDAPAAGRVSTPSAPQVAWVPQEPEHSFVASTVREEVLASPWATDPEHADRLLERAGLAHLARANPYAISGGEQRRLALVAALATRPRLLVLDEPTVGLDAGRWRAVVELMDEARAQGCAVLAATHDEDLVAHADTEIRIADAAAEEAVLPPPDPTIRPVRISPPAPADSLNPLVAVLIAVLGAIGSFGVTTWQAGLLSLVPLILLAPLAMHRGAGTVVRLALVLLSAAGLTWSTALLSPAPLLSAQAWLLGLKEGLRITLFITPGVLVLACIDPTALGDALGGLLRLPGRVVAASVAGLVRAGHLTRQWDTIMTARRLRGLGATRSWRRPVRTLTSTISLLASCTFALLVDSLRSAGEQSIAMDARGFAQAQHRTWALPSRFGRADVLGVLAGIVLLVTPFVMRALST